VRCRSALPPVISHHRRLYTWLISQGLFRTREYPNLPTILEHTGSKNFVKLKTAGMNGMYLADLLCTNRRRLALFMSRGSGPLPVVCAR
jgi:hypothetical protein